MNTDIPLDEERKTLDEWTLAIYERKAQRSKASREKRTETNEQESDDE